jgi:hypothetical protein
MRQPAEEFPAVAPAPRGTAILAVMGHGRDARATMLRWRQFSFALRYWCFRYNKRPWGKAVTQSGIPKLREMR